MPTLSRQREGRTNVLQSFDSEISDADRSRWVGLLARAPLEALEQWAANHAGTEFEWLRRPERGLVMLQGRAGGTGERFNVGEMTVTRCTLRLQSGACGVAYVQGHSARRAECSALADALLQQPDTSAAVQRELIDPLAARLQSEAALMQRKAQATRVEFFTVVRGED